MLVSCHFKQKTATKNSQRVVYDSWAPILGLGILVATQEGDGFCLQPTCILSNTLGDLASKLDINSVGAEEMPDNSPC